MTVVSLLHPLTSIIHNPFRTVSPITYHLPALEIPLQRRQVYQPHLTDLDAFEPTVSQKTSKVLDAVTAEFSGNLERDVLLQFDFRGISLEVKPTRARSDLSPMRRVVRLPLGAALLKAHHCQKWLDR
jgi:hypothetical protein